MKNLFQRIPVPFKKGLLFGFGILFAGIVLAQVDLNFGDVNNVPYNKEAGDEVTSEEFNSLINDVRIMQNSLRTGCEEGYVLQGLDLNGLPLCVVAGEGQGDIPVPTGIVATVTDDGDTSTVTLTWANDGIGTYDVEHTGGSSLTGGGTTDGEVRAVVATTIEWPELVKGIHTFRVRGTQEGTSGKWSNPVSVITLDMTTTPGVPEELTLGNPANRVIPLNWSAPVNDGGTPITGYEIRMRMENPSASVTTTMHAVNTSFSGGGTLVNATGLDTRVVPVQEGRSVVVTDNGYVITDDFSSVVTANNTTLTTTDISNNIGSIRENAGDFQVISNPDFRGEYVSADDRFDANNVSATVSIRPDGSARINLSVGVSVDGETTSFDWPRIVGGHTYYFKIRAMNAKGWGPFTGEVGISVAPDLGTASVLQNVQQAVFSQFQPDADDDGVPDMYEQTLPWIDNIPCELPGLPDVEDFQCMLEDENDPGDVINVYNLGP